MAPLFNESDEGVALLSNARTDKPYRLVPYRYTAKNGWCQERTNPDASTVGHIRILRPVRPCQGIQERRSLLGPRLAAHFYRLSASSRNGATTNFSPITENLLIIPP